MKPVKSRYAVDALRRHKPTAADTPLPFRLRSSSPITPPLSPFPKRSLTAPELKRAQSLPPV